MKKINNTDIKNDVALQLHKLAKYSILLGLLSGILSFFTAIPSIVCGHLVMYKIKKNPSKEKETYKRMAIGGLVFGYIGFILWLIIVFMFKDIFWE